MGRDLSLADWLQERHENTLRLAKQKRGEDRIGWMEDASYFSRAREAVRLLTEASADDHANVPIRMFIALKILRAWNSGTAGYDAAAVLAVNGWIDNGMKGPVPWPECPFFNEWAVCVGFSRVGDYVGFKFDVDLTSPPPPLGRT